MFGKRETQVSDNDDDSDDVDNDDDDDNNDDDDDDDDERSSLHFPRQEEKKVIESRKLIEYDPGKYNRPNVSLGMRKNGSKLNGKVFQLVTSFSINLVTSEGGDSSEMLRTIIFKAMVVMKRIASLCHNQEVVGSIRASLGCSVRS